MKFRGALRGRPRPGRSGGRPPPAAAEADYFRPYYGAVRGMMLWARMATMVFCTLRPSSSAAS